MAKAGSQRKRTTVPPPSSEETPRTDPEGVAADLLGENGSGGGASAPSPVSSTERVRRYRARMREKEEPPTDPNIIEVTDAEVREAAELTVVTWQLFVIPLTREKEEPRRHTMRELDDEQAEKMGRVVAPLIKRYAPLLGRWRYEFMAVVALVSVIRASYIPPDQRVAPEVASG